MNNKKSKDDGVLGVLLTNIILMGCGALLVYVCVIDPLITPQNKEFSIVCLIAGTILLVAKQINFNFFFDK